MSGPRQLVIGYGRVSTEEQESNYSMDAQRSRFDTLVKQNRWQSLGFFPETGSGTSVLNRPVLDGVLGANFIFGPLEIKLHFAYPFDLGDVPRPAEGWVTNLSFGWLYQ